MDLVSRAKGILLSPKNEWATIDSEPATVAGVYTGYIVPLAAIPAIAGFIGLTLLGYNVLGTTIRYSMGAGIERAVAQYVLTLVGVYVLALIIDALAPTFGGQKNQIQALKVAAYSSTASWIAGVFAILPALAVLSILGLYSLYLLYLGLPSLMKAPQEKAMGYTVVVVVCAIVLFILVGAVAAAVVPAPPLGGLVH
jgi:Yip1 domain